MQTPYLRGQLDNKIYCGPISFDFLFYANLISPIPTDPTVYGPIRIDVEWLLGGCLVGFFQCHLGALSCIHTDTNLHGWGNEYTLDSNWTFHCPTGVG